MIVRSNALALPLRDACVDLIVTSPPYFALRSYRDGDEHYAGQLGSEETPGAFVDALVEATREMVRVLKPTGSIFVNLGDKYAGSGGHNNSGLAMRDTYDERSRPGVTNKAAMKKIEGDAQGLRRDAPRSYNKNSDGIPAKSLMGLPWRYANACVDRLGLILRRDLIWHKPNGLPESVTDRCRSSHEYWFHFVKQGRYFSAMDEIREAHAPTAIIALNPLGKLPGSVWTIPSEPLVIPDWARQKYNLPDHFAAFPQEWPRRLILGWSPTGICTACGEGRRPTVDVEYQHLRSYRDEGQQNKFAGRGGEQVKAYTEATKSCGQNIATITGYACACDVPIAPTRPAVVLDPFGGTGTVAMVARTLGRIGLSGDLSGDYCRLARWRIYESGHAAKSEDRTWRDAQGAML